MQTTICPPWVLNEELEIFVKLSAQVYERRVDALQARMRETGTDFVIIYGDREHFANIEYFTRYDCRFEEGLFILGKDGARTIVVGNEGEGYSYCIPYPIQRIVYRHFSLQGQPRGGIQKLRDVFAQVGMSRDARVGFVGIKYFEGDMADDPQHAFDVPAYMIDELRQVVNTPNITNYTREITGLPNGVRMRLRDAEEVAVLEYQAVKAANVMRGLLKNVKPGMSETQIARTVETDFAPTQMYPLVNVTPESVRLGLRSPMADCVLQAGEVLGLCYSLRGSLCSKVGVAARDEGSVCARLKGTIDTFYAKHWEAVARWIETLRVGATGGELYQTVMRLIGDPAFGVALNPGHYIGMDEWTNSCSYQGSTVPIHSGSVLQTDIIASSPDQPMVSICEDTVIVADEAFQQEIAAQYPDVYARLLKRREMMRDALGIVVHDDVLPLTGLTGVMFPYMLDLTQVYTLKA